MPLPPTVTTTMSTTEDKVDGDGGGGSSEAAGSQGDMGMSNAEIEAENDKGTSSNASIRGEESAGGGSARAREEEDEDKRSMPSGRLGGDGEKISPGGKKPCDACRGMHRAHTCERAITKSTTSPKVMLFLGQSAMHNLLLPPIGQAHASDPHRGKFSPL